MQAAMSAVFTIGAIAGEADKSTSPAVILTRLNRSIFAHSRRGHFVAFLLAALDPAQKTVTFANAGQTKPLLKSRGVLTWLEPPGVRFPLGMKEDSTYEEMTVQLAPGDILFMLTDGFTEAMNMWEEMYGAERMEEVVRDGVIDGLTPAAIIGRLTSAVHAYAAGAPQHDDMTIVVVKVL
jgi:sigma-B regulation protein RsbU (phosphoserine phosphatase)